MTEDQILNQWHALIDHWYLLLQWWAGISFGVIAVAHFAADKLKWPIVIVVLLVYVSQTANTFLYAIKMSGLVAGIRHELELLRDSGSASAIGTAWLDSQDPPWSQLTYSVAAGGLFIGCISYLVYRYVEQRR